MACNELAHHAGMGVIALYYRDIHHHRAYGMLGEELDFAIPLARSCGLMFWLSIS